MMKRITYCFHILLILGISKLRTTFANDANVTETAGTADVSAMFYGSAAAVSAVFTNSQALRDTNGNKIYAYAGCVVPYKGKYYWFGQSQLDGPGITSDGVNCYSSNDLKNWKYEGLALDATSYNAGYAKPYRTERPKVIYNRKTKKWVMLWHQDNGFWPFVANEVGIATSGNVVGPYKFVKGIRPGGKTSWDMTVFQYPETGDAFIVNSVDLKSLGFHKLSDDYMSVSKPFCGSAPRAEAPCIFSAKGKMYMFASGLKNWDPNPAKQFISNKGICGPWTKIFGPAPNSKTTYDTQPGFVFPYKFPSGKTLFIYLGDRWNQKNDIKQAITIWLPMVPKGNGFQIRNVAKWSIKDFEWAAI